MSKGSRKQTQLTEEIDSLAEEIEEINSILYNIAHNSTSRKEIKLDRIDWRRVDEVDEQYEVWYNRAFTLVTEYLPERRSDFRNAYSDMDKFIHFDGMKYTKIDGYGGLLRRAISRQRNLLLSIPPKLETERLKVRKGISDEIVTEELYQAKDLLDDGDLRAAGVVAGVALERYLLTLCEVSERDLEFEYTDGIRSLTETLYQADEFSQTRKGQLEYLADIRNDCAHVNEEEPDKREVERLIKQSEEIVREV